MPAGAAPIRIAIIDDYDIVLAGVAHMLAPYEHRVRVVEIDANTPPRASVDIALYDSFAQPGYNDDDIAALTANPHVARVVVYSWNFEPHLVERAREQGAHGYLSKALPARELVDALEAVHAGKAIVSDPPPRTRTGLAQDWPGRREGLTDREAEVLALITQGHSNAEIAEATFLSPNTIKSYIRTIYQKIHVSSRTQAVIWGVNHGFQPDHHRIDLWRPSPR